jgi:hypothetical protein
MTKRDHEQTALDLVRSLPCAVGAVPAKAAFLSAPIALEWLLFPKRIMKWVAPSENHSANGALEKRLRHAAGMTAAELIAERADAAQPNMGLTAWKVGIVRKGDVTVAKNYLREEEITELNRIVVMFLDFAEDQAKRRKQVFLRDWQIRLDDFLRFNERNILSGPGKVSHEQAERRAHEQYGKFEDRRR